MPPVVSVKAQCNLLIVLLHCNRKLARTSCAASWFLLMSLMLVSMVSLLHLNAKNVKKLQLVVLPNTATQQCS